MKKLTARYWRHLLHRAECERRHRRARPPEVVSLRRHAAQTMFEQVRALLPATDACTESRPGFLSLRPPGRLSLEDNYEATLAFIMDLRSYFYRRRVRPPGFSHNLRIFADFAKLRSVEPAAGLVLAAEVDRWRLGSGKAPRAYDSDWDPAVRQFFAEAGLFQLLGIEPEQVEPDAANAAAGASVRTLQFVRGMSVNGALGSDLRDRLEALCGKEIGPRMTVYDAIAEAIANTRHAYPPGTAIWPTKETGRWWASASWLPAQNRVAVQLYDHGVGIPATLPRSPHWTDILNSPLLTGLIHPERKEGQLLAAALEVGRTSTGVQGRGKGLAEMMAWIDTLGDGFLRIISGRGKVVYERGGPVRRSQLGAPFPGTLIEWELGLGG